MTWSGEEIPLHIQVRGLTRMRAGRGQGSRKIAGAQDSSKEETEQSNFATVVARRRSTVDSVSPLLCNPVVKYEFT